jgi:cytochrome P450
MGLLHMSEDFVQTLNVKSALLTALVAAVTCRMVYVHFFHPLSGFNGPWYARSSSLFIAILSVMNREPEWLMYVIRKYGDEKPIRVTPNVLLFPSPSALRDIYWDQKCNTKGRIYGSGLFGNPNVVNTMEAGEHRALRKSLSNGPWTIGPLKRNWEPRFDELIELFAKKMHEHAVAGRTVNVADKVALFALDIMSSVSFTDTFGCIESQSDVKNILENWRRALTFFGFFTRYALLRDYVLRVPGMKRFFKPKAGESGLGWLIGEANRQVSVREKENEEKSSEEKSDLLQHCLDARFSDGSPLDLQQRQAQAFLLIAAGADTTATALGAVLRMLYTHPKIFAQVRAEIEAAEKAGHLSSVIRYEETRQHLPLIVACIKESLRLFPPAPQFLVRITPPEGRTIDGHFVPGSTEIATYSYCVQRSLSLYGPDADEFKPERWMESEKRNFELDAVQATFGVGFRGCMGKDIAMMELHKLLPEIVRRFDFELENPGRYIADGGIAYHKDFTGKFILRQPS